MEQGERLGSYRILRRLGAGAMGEVWLARHEHLDVLRALKVLPRALAQSSAFQQRFRQEARLLAHLKHPHIVQVHDMVVEGDTYGIAMAFVSPDGESPQTLEDLVKARGGRLPGNEAKPIMLQMCDAVACAHAHGVLHRDLKPANVLIDRNGEVRVADFGLAKVVGEEFLRSSIAAGMSGSVGGKDSRRLGSKAGSEKSLGAAETHGAEPEGSSASRSLVGTYNFMPPEVQEGGEWTERGDVYSLGCIAYAMLTGNRPVGRFRLPSELRSDVPVFWDRLIERALEFNPEQRWESVDAMRSELAATATAATPGQYDAAPLRHRRWRPMFAAQLLLVIVAAVVAGTVFTLRSGRERTEKVVGVEQASSPQFNTAPRMATPSSATTFAATPIPITPTPTQTSALTPTLAVDAQLQDGDKTQEITRHVASASSSQPVPGSTIATLAAMSPAGLPSARAAPSLTDATSSTAQTIDELTQKAEQAEHKLTLARKLHDDALNLEAKDVLTTTDKIRLWESVLETCRGANYRTTDVHERIAHWKQALEVDRARAAYGSALQIDQNNETSPTAKLQAWQEYLTRYSVADVETTAARERIAYWTEEPNDFRLVYPADNSVAPGGQHELLVCVHRADGTTASDERFELSAGPVPSDSGWKIEETTVASGLLSRHGTARISGIGTGIPSDGISKTLLWQKGWGHQLFVADRFTTEMHLFQTGGEIVLPLKDPLVRVSATIPCQEGEILPDLQVTDLRTGMIKRLSEIQGSITVLQIGHVCSCSNKYIELCNDLVRRRSDWKGSVVIAGLLMNSPETCRKHADKMGWDNLLLLQQTESLGSSPPMGELLGMPTFPHTVVFDSQRRILMSRHSPLDLEMEIDKLLRIDRPPDSNRHTLEWAHKQVERKLGSTGK